jgi:hypothetical protein
MKRLLLTSAVFAGLAIVLQAENICLAGRYSSSAAYRVLSNSPVYGFRSNGQSFTYQPSGNAASYNTSGSPTAYGGYGPQYRFDSFISPRTATSTPIDSQPYYFSGRMWYPRKF